MTFRQIYVAWGLGISLTVAADFGPLPEPLAWLGLVVVIGGTAAGGADGTLPRM